MITLKNGETVEHREDFDEFFRNMVRAVIKSSFARPGTPRKGDTGNRFDSVFSRNNGQLHLHHPPVRELARGVKLFDAGHGLSLQLHDTTLFETGNARRR